jgi:hypothetical protein
LPAIQPGKPGLGVLHFFNARIPPDGPGGTIHPRGNGHGCPVRTIWRNEMKKNVTPEKFVEVWQTSRTIKEVVEKIDVNPTAAYNRALYYRKHGVKLKKFSALPKKIDWTVIRKLALRFR